jgi:CubicO group peptidase (beta-lactamase class C family)
MQLRDRGLLSLDDPVTKYIPELQKVRNEHGSMDEITIGQLMSHTSGFRGPTWPWGGSEEWHPHEPQHWRQLEAMFPYTEIKFKPGSRWSYSNPAFIFLGRIIELITKDDYEYYVEKNIWQPMQMDSSYFDKTPYHLLDNLAQSYYLQNDGSYQQARFDLNTGITVSNGGLSAPIGDMIKYLDFLLGNADGQLYEHVLSCDSIREMFEPQIDIAASDDSRENVTAYQMGLSFFVTDRKDMRLISHSGGQNGFISHIYMVPEKNMAYVVAYNNMGETRTLDRKLNEFIIENIFSEIEHAE